MWIEVIAYTDTSSVKDYDDEQTKSILVLSSDLLILLTKIVD